MAKKTQQKPIRIEDYNGIWAVSSSQMPLIDKSGKRIKVWPDKVLELIVSDQSGLAYMARRGNVGPAEKFVRKVRGTHYEACPDYAGGYLQVYRLRPGKTATEGKWPKPNLRYLKYPY